MKTSLFRSWLSTPDRPINKSPDISCHICTTLEQKLDNAKVALVLADKYGEKLTRAREDFVHKLADQIRVPLHGVVGICTSMACEDTLPQECLIKIGIISQTSSQILATINELLQVTTVESGRMCMENVAFDPRKRMQLVMKLLTRKLNDKRVVCCINVDDTISKTLARDVSRLRHCLFAIADTLLEESNPDDVLEMNLRVVQPDEQIIATMPRSKRYVPCLYELKLRRIPELEVEDMQLVDTEKEGDPQIVTSAELAQGLSGRLLHTPSYTAFHMIVHFCNTIGGASPSPSLRYSTFRDPVDKGRKFTILLYEENPVFLRSVCKNLATKGHLVDIVRDTDEVIPLAHSGTVHKTYDCVLVDTSEGGFNFIKSIRQFEQRTWIGRITILLSITYGLDGWERRYMDAGVDGHFLKPCSDEVIITRITDAISAVNSLVAISERSVSQNSSSSVRLDS
jgi:CheY-like chemotaxis protein